MTVQVKQLILATGYVLTILLCAAFAYSCYMIVRGHPQLMIPETLSSHPRWFSYKDTTDVRTAVYWSLAGILVANLLILVAGIRLSRLHQRTGSPELFFFLISLYTLSLESLRALAGIAFFADVPVYVGVTLSRAIYFGRMCGLLTLLFSSLYLADMKYPRVGILLSVALLVSLSFSVSIPIDSSVFVTSMVYKLGVERASWFATLVLSVIVVINVAGAAFIKRRLQFALLSGALTAYQIGRELLHFSTGPIAFGMQLILLSAAVWVISKQFERHFLWM